MALPTRARIAGILAISLLMLSSPAARAGCGPDCYKPDVRVRLPGGVLKGNNIYNLTATGQLAAALAAPGKTRQFVLSIQNDGTENDSFRLSLGGQAGNGDEFKPVYMVGWLAPQDVSFEINDAEFITPTLAPGQVYFFRVYVAYKITGAGGANYRQEYVNANSMNDTTKNDAAAWRLTAK